MKGFLIRFISFGLLSVLTYIILVIVWGLTVPGKLKPNLIYVLGGTGNLNSRLREADTTKNIDILFLGTSHAYRGYDTRIFKKAGYRVFNLGSSAQTPVQTEYLLKKYLTRLNPKLIIFDIYPLVLGSDGTESTLDLMANSKKVDAGILKMTLHENNAKTYNTLIYTYFRQIFSLDKNHIGRLENAGDRYVKGGYVETNRVYKNKRKYTTTDYILNPDQLDAVKRIIGQFKQNKTAFLIVQAPLSYGLYKSINNNDKVDAILGKLGPYENFNNCLTLPDSAFADDNHLNQYGVNLYNATFINYIKSRHFKGN